MSISIKYMNCQSSLSLISIIQYIINIIPIYFISKVRRYHASFTCHKKKFLIQEKKGHVFGTHGSLATKQQDSFIPSLFLLLLLSLVRTQYHYGRNFQILPKNYEGPFASNMPIKSNSWLQWIRASIGIKILIYLS